jgi:hypothetical protein
VKRHLFASSGIVSLLALAACVGPTPQKPTGPLSVRGAVRGLDFPQHARIAVYRVTEGGVVERMQRADIEVDSDGRFQSEPLNPDRYLFAMRSPGRPPSIMRVRVPPAPPMTLVARAPLGQARLEIRRNADATAPVSVLLSRVDEGLPVVDRRSATVGDAVSLIEGLTPGRWRLDVLGTGSTTEIEVPEAPKHITLTLANPPIGVGAEMKGRVMRTDGSPAAGLAVTVRPLAEDGSAALAWGRFALTNSDGGYHLVALPPGPALLRIESRDAVFRRVPAPEIVTIPPSGGVDRSFVVAPD